MTLLPYFVCCIAQLTHPLTSGIRESKNAYVPKADILNTWRKLPPVEKKTKK